MDPNIQLRELLNRYLRNSCTEEEVQLLLDYLKRADNEPELKQILNDYWQDIDEKEISEGTGFHYDKDEWFEEIYSKALNKDDSIGHSNKRLNFRTYVLPSNNKRPPLLLKVAAILLIAVTMSYLFYFFATDTSTDSPAYSQKIAAAGEKVRFVLPDGTQVHLNSESRLTFPEKFSNSSREVQLQGEGYFIVTKDKERPFLVYTKEITTKVLGTSFSIRSYPEDDQTVVAVRSGKVSVAESGSTDRHADVILEPNEFVNYTFTDHQFTTGEGITAFTAWNSGVLLYHDKELGEVANQLERWYGVDINFENEAIKKCIVRGEHRDESLTNVLEAITYAFDMEYSIDDRRVLLQGQGCN